MQITLNKFSYKKMEYEKEFCLREIKTLFPMALISDTKDAIVLDNIQDDEIVNLSKLTYIDSYTIGDSIEYTLQSRLERSASDNCDNLKRQSTRYSVHGLHEYKGKFNPQIVNVIKNILNLSDDVRILEPFCGSGTTLVELAHRGIQCIGIDINPMAAFIANTKIQALSIDLNRLEEKIEEIYTTIIRGELVELIPEGQSSREDYLRKWIPERELRILETVINLIANEGESIQNIIKLTFSDLIREYSYQEPSDMRIRRRISPFPEEEMIQVWHRNICKYLSQIRSARVVVGEPNVHNYALNDDIKQCNLAGQQFDGAITSPPYATALPYIDTQRISLVWLEMCQPEEIMRLEATLIGSREIVSQEKIGWTNRKSTNEDELPAEIYDLVRDIERNLSPKDGFRKKAMPALLYRYFAEMKQMFINVSNHIVQGGKFALVVGHNKTTAGGEIYQIDTPRLLALLSTYCGWNILELIPLQTYKRYGINSKNAINQETLIILEKI